MKLQFFLSHSNDIVSWEDTVNHYCMWIIGHHDSSELFYTNKMTHTLGLSIKSCSLGPELHPSLDASPPPGCCCLQSNEILLNQGMKYWNSALNARGARTFIATVHIAGAVIGWRRSGKERTGRPQFSTQFAAKLSFMPRCWSPVYFFPLFFEISSPNWPKQGFPMPSFPDFTDNFITKQGIFSKSKFFFWVELKLFFPS